MLLLIWDDEKYNTKKILPSFIDPEKSLLAKILDPKKSLESPHPHH